MYRRRLACISCHPQNAGETTALHEAVHGCYLLARTDMD